MSRLANSSSTLLHSYEVNQISILQNIKPTSVLNENAKILGKYLSLDDKKKHLHLEDQEKHLYLNDQRKCLHLDDQAKHLNLDDHEEHLHLDDHQKHLQLDDHEKHLHLDDHEIHLHVDDQEQHLHLDDQENHLHLDDQEEHLHLDDQEKHLDLGDQGESSERNIPMTVDDMKKELSGRTLPQGISEIVFVTAIMERRIKFRNDMISWIEGWKQNNMFRQSLDKQLTYVGFKKREITISLFIKKNENPNRDLRLWLVNHRNDALDSLIRCIKLYRKFRVGSGKQTNFAMMQALGIKPNLINYVRTIQRFQVMRRVKILKQPRSIMGGKLGMLEVGEIVEGMFENMWVKHYRGWSMFSNGKVINMKKLKKVEKSFDSLLDTVMNVAWTFSAKDWQKLEKFAKKDDKLAGKTGKKAARQNKLFADERNRMKGEQRNEENAKRLQEDEEYKRKKQREREEQEEKNKRKVEEAQRRKKQLEEKRQMEMQRKQREEEDRQMREIEANRKEEERKRREEQRRFEEQQRKELEERRRAEAKLLQEKQKRLEEAKKQEQNKIDQKKIYCKQQRALVYGLPRGYDINWANGRPYFMNDVTKQTQWNDPRPLPPGYEAKVAAGGKIYYINHAAQTTQWIDPRPALPPMRPDLMLY